MKLASARVLGIAQRSNSLQLIRALQDAGKSFDVQVGPDRGHSSMNQDRMMEFFIDTLRPQPD